MCVDMIISDTFIYVNTSINMYIYVYSFMLHYSKNRVIL